MAEQQKLQILVDVHLKSLLEQEDLDHDLRITKEDTGPKNFTINTLDGQRIQIKGHYFLSNLLQQLAHAHTNGEKVCEICIDEICQNPVDQINQQIHHYYWDALTRTFDKNGLIKLLEDPKKAKMSLSRIYVPMGDEPAYEYFNQVSQDHRYLKLEVCQLPFPKNLTSAELHKLDRHPGLLSLSIHAMPELGNPFIVPGGRFNEMYGWDSYFIIEGLLCSKRTYLATSMLKHLIYQIHHYGKILNGNRSYYLSRSQPPFLTSILQLLINDQISKTLLTEALDAAIYEYLYVWHDYLHCPQKKLCRYFGEGTKEPIEVEAHHFDPIYDHFAEKARLSMDRYRIKYLAGQIKEPLLDEYFIHDRSMRESGHDTTYRLLNLSAHLYPVDLNSLLYKYEKDIAFIIEKYFQGHFIDLRGHKHNSNQWYSRAEKNKELMNQWLWDDKDKIFYDYNFETKSPHQYESATTFYPLFAGLASQSQAKYLIENTLKKFEMPGGVVSSTESSRGKISQNRPLRQWDYPFGWAPHQMLLWKGCINYGYQEVAQRLAYKWLLMVAQEAKDFNGAITEKYDVVQCTHKLEAEYGNVGKEFGLYPDGGFAWVNASFLFGQTILTSDQLQSLKEMKPAHLVFN